MAGARRLMTSCMQVVTRRPLTTYTQSDYVIRRATHADYDGIKDVSRQAYSHGYKSDYMAGMLPVYLEDANRLLHVAERKKDKKLVGVLMALGGLDDGLGFHGEGGRVIPSYHNRGVMRNMFRSIGDDFGQRWPRWQWMNASSTNTGHFDTILNQIQILLKRMVLRIHVKPQDIERYLSKGVHQMPPPQALSSPQLSDILDDDTRKQSLYPEGFIVLEHVIFNAWTCNVPMMLSSHDCVLHHSHQAESLSIGGTMSVNDDKTWRVNVNYTGPAHLGTFNSHLHHQLQHHMENLAPRDDMYVILAAPKLLKDSVGLTELKQFWAEQFSITDKDNIVCLDQYCFEYLPNSSIMTVVRNPEHIKRSNS